MKSMKKVEVVIESVYQNRLLEIFTKHGIKGYTIINDIEGCGSHGLKRADEVSDVFSNEYVFTVCDDSTLDNMKDEILLFTRKYGGKCFVSDTMMLV